jgi:hypothetical protein
VGEAKNMTRILTCLLALFFSLSGPASERNAGFWRSSLAAESGSQTFQIMDGVRRAVRFSQSSISRNFSTGGTIDDLAAGLRSGSVNPASIPPIRLVQQEGNLFTLDNRRLWSFQQAEVPVPFRMATSQERAASGAANAGATDWELLQIRQNPQFWDTLTFWKNGQVAPNPFK